MVQRFTFTLMLGKTNEQSVENYGHITEQMWDDLLMSVRKINILSVTL